MKIIKILFLGIVLVLCNLAILAAQTLPDTISVTIPSAEPGGVMEVTVDVRFHSTNASGFIIVLLDFPKGLFTTGTGVDISDGAAAPTAPGTWWYEWTAGYGKVLKSNASLTADVIVDPGNADTNPNLTVSVLGANVDQLKLLPQPFGFNPAAIGPVIKIRVNVPSSIAEGTYPIVADEVGRVIGQFNPAGVLDGVPYTSVSPLVIANIPDDNSLSLQASLEALPGGTLSLPVKIANRDSVGSGPNSFTLDYDSAVLTLTSITPVTAGARAGGSTFSVLVSDATMLAAAKRATVTFSGGTIPPGGSGALCTINFSIAQVASGTSASVTLAGVSLKGPSGAALAVVDPSTPTTSLTFFAGDSLSFGSMQGEGAAIIMDGQLHVPIVLKNTVAVSMVEFYIQEPAGKEGVLTLAASPIAHVNRATDWMVSASDSGSYVHVIAYDPNGTGSIAAGTGSLFHVVYDIHLAAGDVPTGNNTYDLNLAFKGVNLVDGSGHAVGIKTVAGIASLDYRVPLGGEAVDQGASLPKAFALAQNHPNPFNPSTTINYQIPDDVGSINISLNVYDIRGRLVRTLAEGLKGAGSYSTFWDGTDNSGRQVGSGVYFYRFSSSKFNATRKMILLK